ncbi:MAG: hypothetical protein IPM32_17020 [Ignavibacteriae bacterium]|nr:hypothetical protein [Ignavibacteriota bacterium]
MVSKKGDLLEFYLDDEEMNEEEVNTYLFDIGKDPVKLKTEALKFVKKLEAENKIKEGKIYLSNLKEVLNKILKGEFLQDFDDGIRSKIQFQFNKQHNNQDADLESLLDQQSKLEIIKYLKKHKSNGSNS